MMMRVQKYLSQRGILSRRAAEEYIKKGAVYINGAKAKLGDSVDPDKDIVDVKAATQPAFESVLVYKPRNTTSAKSSGEGKTIFEVFPQYEHLHVAGRLDKESEGLLILSNDGILAKQLTSEKHLVEKEYEVHVQEKLRGPELGAMAHGLKLRDGPTLPALVHKTGPHTFTIVLKEGRNHQIRRMCDKVHLTVTRLVRKRIGTISTKGLRSGASRPLTAAEIAALKSLR